MLLLWTSSIIFFETYPIYDYRLLMRSTRYHADRVWYWLTETERQSLSLLDKVYMFPVTCETKQKWNRTKRIETNRNGAKQIKRKRNKIEIGRNKWNMTVGLISLYSVSSISHSPAFLWGRRKGNCANRKKNELGTYKKMIGRRACTNEIGGNSRKESAPYLNFGDEQIRYLDSK